MTDKEIAGIFSGFIADDDYISSEPFGGGHINDTYKITGRRGVYTLQRINKNVFSDPPRVMENIAAVTRFISEALIESGADPSRGTLHAVNGVCGKPYHIYNGEYYRMYHFIDGVKSLRGEYTPGDMYRAARAFGNFQLMLSDFPADRLYKTIPDFHNTPKRYADLIKAARLDTVGRRRETGGELAGYEELADIYPLITDALACGDVPVRVTHNDTKLDNILFDAATGEGICVIDLDTVMPGSLLYDFGDSLRSGMNPVAEDGYNAQNTSIPARMDMFRAYAKGYIEVMGGYMTPCELELLSVSPCIMTAECGMRFLTDYLCGDVYFKTSRPRQNLDRARVQLALARDMKKHVDEMGEYIIECAGKGSV